APGIPRADFKVHRTVASIRFSTQVYIVCLAVCVSHRKENSLTENFLPRTTLFIVDRFIQPVLFYILLELFDDRMDYIPQVNDRFRRSDSELQRKLLRDRLANLLPFKKSKRILVKIIGFRSSIAVRAH